MSTFLKSANFSGTNGSHFEIQIYYDILSQDVSQNTSNVRFYLKMKSKDGYSGSGGTASGYINTHLVGQFSSIGVNQTIDIGYFDENNIPHNTYGTRNLTYSAYIDTPWSLGDASVSGAFDLPKINRVAITNSVEGNNVEGTFKVNYTKYVDNYTYRLRISIPNVEMLQTTEYTSGDDISLNDGALSVLLYRMTSNEINLGFAVETWDGDTQLSEGNEIVIKCRLTNANPIFSDFDFEDVNTITKSLTGSTKNNVINVNGYSNIQATITTSNKAEAIKEATMTKYRLAIGDSSTDITYSNTEDVSGTINGASNGTYNLYAIDNRNNSTLVIKQATQVIAYDKIYLDKQNCSFVRDNNQVGQNAILTLSGTFWNDDFGQVVNSIKSITYKLKKSNSSTWIDGTTTITPTISGNNFTFTGMIASDNLDTTWDLDSSYNLEVIISDELSSANVEFILNSAVPTMSLDKNGVGIMCAYDSNIGGKLQVGGKVIDEDICSTSETLTNKVWIDGKPIYRQVFDYGQLPNNTSVGVNHNISIDTPISCLGIVFRTTGNINSWTLPTANIFIDLDRNQVYITTTSDRRDLTCKAIIEYTKTTD